MRPDESGPKEIRTGLDLYQIRSSLSSRTQILYKGPHFQAVTFFIPCLLRQFSFNLVKIHVMHHFNDAIRHSGSPFEYSTNIYEHLYINLMKSTYQPNNRHDYTGQILKHLSQLQSYWRKVGEVEAFESTIEKVTALDQVHYYINLLCFEAPHRKELCLLTSSFHNNQVN